MNKEKKKLKLDLKSIGAEVEISDGYHTFDELYDHCITLYIALCKQLSNFKYKNKKQIWRSKLHNDGLSYDGWFILGIHDGNGQQITYHIPIERWEETNWADTRALAPIWDNHNSQDVLERLKSL